MAIDVDRVLVAADSSDKSSEAADYAIALAHRYEADLHLLHFLDHRVMRGIETGDVETETVARQQRSLTQYVQDNIPDESTVGFSHSGAAGFSTTRLGQTPGTVILDVASELSADFLVVPRQTPSANAGEVLGKSALHVLEYASQPVLSV